MALAYLLMCHHSPGHVDELFRHIYRDEHAYLLHADRKAAAAVHQTLARLAAAHPNVRVLPSALCSWGGWSLVETTLRGIAAAVALPVSWRHLVLLSESHLPLRSPEETDTSLVDGVSYLDAAPVAGMYPAGRDDVLHRFAARYREVAGVGMFAVEPRAIDTAFAARLHHGSQWMVLARIACDRVAAYGGADAVWDPFRTSLLPDETALQTVLRGTASAQDLAFEGRNPTFVAWPHLGGGPDMVFTERNFHEARATYHLFIRKRPAVLPDSVTAALAASRPAPPLPVLPDAAHDAGHRVAVNSLMSGLREHLDRRFPGLHITAPPPAHPGASETCYVQLRCAGLSERLFAAVVSQDLSHFKVLLVSQPSAGDSVGLGTLGGYPTSVLKVWLPHLFLGREMLLPELPDGGFIVAGEADRVARLVPALVHALDAGLRLPR